MGFTSNRILLFQSINSIIALIGEACCVLWVDQTGRRRPLIIGNIASGLSFVVGSVLMARWPGTVNKYVLKYPWNAPLIAGFSNAVRTFSENSNAVLVLSLKLLIFYSEGALCEYYVLWMHFCIIDSYGSLLSQIFISMSFLNLSSCRSWHTLSSHVGT